jgi:NAD(P)H-dependent FMN reductase
MSKGSESDHILIFAGSTRAESVNQQLANKASFMAQKMGAKVTIVDLNDFAIPFYNADLEAKDGMPFHAKRLRDLMIAHRLIIIVSPEYNASIPAVLKNALDWASRGETGGPSRDAFKGKRFALMSASPSPMGGSRGLVHLRAIIEAIGGEVIKKQVCVAHAYETGVFETSAFKEEVQEELAELIANHEM